MEEVAKGGFLDKLDKDAAGQWARGHKRKWVHVDGTHLVYWSASSMPTGRPSRKGGTKLELQQCEGIRHSFCAGAPPRAFDLMIKDGGRFGLAPGWTELQGDEAHRGRCAVICSRR